jgi:uncharacterized protein YpbB
LSNIYFYKRNLFALVSKANLILPSYSLQISYTLNLYSQEILTKNLFTSLIAKSFQRLVLLYSSSTSNIYTMDDIPKIEGLLDEKIRTQYFSRLQPWMSTTTATIERESLHLIQKSSNKSQPYETKTSRAKKEWSKMMKTQQTFWPTGFIGNAQLISLSCPYLTIIKCA